MREQAIETFDKVGFPKRKDEEWRFTNLAPLLKSDYKLFPEPSEAQVGAKELEKYFVNNIDSYNIVFINGVYNSFLSSSTHEEADICVLSCAMEKMVHQPVIENFYKAFLTRTVTIGDTGIQIAYPVLTVLSFSLLIGIWFLFSKE